GPRGPGRAVVRAAGAGDLRQGDPVAERRRDGLALRRGAADGPARGPVLRRRLLLRRRRRPGDGPAAPGVGAGGRPARAAERADARGLPAAPSVPGLAAPAAPGPAGGPLVRGPPPRAGGGGRLPPRPPGQRVSPAATAPVGTRPGSPLDVLPEARPADVRRPARLLLPDQQPPRRAPICAEALRGPDGPVRRRGDLYGRPDVLEEA